MTIIQHIQDRLFWWKQNRIKQKNATNKFKRRSRAAKLGWQKRKEI